MRADRLLSILLILQAKGSKTAQELALQLEVSERTIYRDVEALSYSGIPIYTHPGASGGIFLDEGYRGTMGSLTTAEAQAIVLTSTAVQLEDLGMEKAASGMLLKLLAALPAAQRDAAERLRQRIYIDPSGWFHTNEPVPFLPLLHKAVWEDRIIELKYQRPDGLPTRRELHPYALVAKANVWYLVGKQLDGEMRTFRIARILDVKPSESCFERPEKFDLTAYWTAQCKLFEKQLLSEDTPCEALVRVHPDSLRSLLSDLAGQYERLPGSSPSGWIELRIQFESPGHARTRMQAFGSRIEVLQPDWLQQVLLDEAREVVKYYEG